MGELLTYFTPLPLYFFSRRTPVAIFCNPSHYAKVEGSLAVAAKYCSRLLECGGADEDWAKKQLREIRAIEQQHR